MPSPVIARTGRQQQRYENNFRLVSGCIPYKLAKDGQRTHHDMESIIEVLMISTLNRVDLVFPKGGWEDDETVEQAACREALEEAGVIGTIKAPLGDWEFRSKSRQEMCSLEGGCRGWMFAMEVTKELEAWPEQGNHNRIWLSIKDAYRLCRYDWMRMALQEFVRIMAANWRQELMEAAAESTSKAVSDPAIDCPITLPHCDAQPLSTQHLDLVSFLRSKSCIQPGPNLGALRAAPSSTQLNLKGTA